MTKLLDVGAPYVDMLKKSDVGIITLTNGVNSRDNSNDDDLEKEISQQKKQLGSLGASWIGAGDFPDNKIDSIPLIDVIKFIESFKIVSIRI